MGTRVMAGHSAGIMRRKGSKGKDPFERHDLKVRSVSICFLTISSFAGAAIPTMWSTAVLST